MNQELKTVFKNSGITILIIFAYVLIIRQKSVYIASTLGAILSIWNLYSMYKDIIAVCISSQQKIKDYLFNQDKNNILSPEEFDQLVKVNKNLI